MEPVATPSSTTTTVRPASGIGGRSPRSARARRATSRIAACSATSYSRRGTWAARVTCSSTMRAPSSLTAPMASSGRCGTPTLRTTITSNGACRASATRAATGTPPRGRASTTGSSRDTDRRCSPRARPASSRSAKTSESARALVHTPPPCPGAHPPGRGFGPHHRAPANPAVLRAGPPQTWRFCAREGPPPGSGGKPGSNLSGVPVQWRHRHRPGHHRRASGRNGRKAGLDPDGWARHSLDQSGRVPPSDRGMGAGKRGGTAVPPGPIRGTSSSCTTTTAPQGRGPTSTETMR